MTTTLRIRAWRAPLLLCGALFTAQARAHGGIGPPDIRLTYPGPGDIVDAWETDTVPLRWDDRDDDDDANIIVYAAADPSSPQALQLNSGTPEDCDAADGGPVFTGAVPDGGNREALSRERCGAVTDACTGANDCLPWTPAGVSPGTYAIQASIDDDRGDGLGDVAFTTAPGLVRVRRDGVNASPAVVLLSPPPGGADVGTCHRVRWRASDPDDEGTVRVWVRAEGAAADTLVGTYAERDAEDGMDLTTGMLPVLSRWVVSVEVDDGRGGTWRSTSAAGLVRVLQGAPDGGCATMVTDAGTADAWAPDAGEGREDAAVPDSGHVGADAGEDAGQDAGQDAGTADAGSARDGGTLASPDGGARVNPPRRTCACTSVGMGHGWVGGAWLLLMVSTARARRRSRAPGR